MPPHVAPTVSFPASRGRSAAEPRMTSALDHGPRLKSVFPPKYFPEFPVTKACVKPDKLPRRAASHGRSGRNFVDIRENDAIQFRIRSVGILGCFRRSG